MRTAFQVITGKHCCGTIYAGVFTVLKFLVHAKLMNGSKTLPERLFVRIAGSIPYWAEVLGIL